MANTKVTGDVIANGTISTVHIADDAITAAKLDSTATGITFADLAVSGNSTLTGNLTVNGAFTSRGIDDNADATAITINGNEEVGIGTTSPTYKLHVAGTTAITGNLTMSTSAEIRSSDGTGIRLRNAANSANEGGFVRSGLWEGDSSRDPSLFAETGLGLRFYTGGSATERMVITSGGDVIIGGTVVENPNSVNRAFEVAAASPVGLILNDTRDANPITLENVGAVFHVSHGTNRRLTILDSSGNVGIGLTSPNQKLDVNGSINITGGTGRRIYWSNGDMAIHNAGSYAMAFETWTGSALTEKMRITSGGDVGIGITSPNCKLDVNGIISPRGNQIRLAGGTDGNHFLQKITTGYSGTTVDGPMLQGHQGGELTTNYGGNSWSLRWATGGKVYMNGDVGIGTSSPSAKLNIVGSSSGSITNLLRIQNPVNSAGTGHGASLILHSTIDSNRGVAIASSSATNYATNNDMLFYTSSSSTLYERMRIDSNGQVGIGTTAPGYKLSVVGSFYSNSVATNTYSNVDEPPAAYVGKGPNPCNSGGMFRLGAVVSSSSANATNVPVVTTYSSGHWGSQPTFFLEFTVSYYRPSYIKYYCQHEVSGTRLDIIEGPYGGQIASTPLSVTVTQLCSNCHGGQPVYKAVWKWSNNGTYLRTAPFITMFGHPNSLVYTDGSSSESAIDTLFGSTSSPGNAYLLHGINNTQAADHPRLSTQT